MDKDKNKNKNSHVERACMEMIRIVNEKRVEVCRLRWNKDYKGIDEWLLYKRA